MSMRSRKRCDTHGFTLIEVLAALAILGTALFVLLTTHNAALSLHQDIDDAATWRHLTEAAVSMAEVEILTGNMEDGGEFGSRYPEFRWHYEAAPAGSDQTILLYQVQLTLRGPAEERQVQFFVYDTGYPSTLDTGSAVRRSTPGGQTSGQGAGFGSQSRGGGAMR